MMISSIIVDVHSEQFMIKDFVKANVDIAVHCLFALDRKIVDFWEILPEMIETPSKIIRIHYDNKTEILIKINSYL